MPGMSGYEVCRRTLSIVDKLSAVKDSLIFKPLIVASSFESDPKVLEEVIEAGFHKFYYGFSDIYSEEVRRMVEERMKLRP
jgi:DNA repair photolyase